MQRQNLDLGKVIQGNYMFFTVESLDLEERTSKTRLLDIFYLY